ncbi:HepT-like ribonuclease domain-containing protein [Iningainema tapete]|uniref:DUF86 domain-containing protein n=1 Tax=Iningainema tapete BLCC-T55 TaxID=2748662 RepID=A0A8J6XVY3_9CYAN|nr:DUF86 domain-containing protein [Iningainema tapete BLCC-T55]
MPSREWPLRIQDILKSATVIIERTASMTFEDFQDNETIAKAVLYDFVIIGEATRNIPVEIRSRYPEIPWRLMGNMRNVMTHEYFQVDLEIIWNAIQNSLPLLIPQIQDLMEREEIEQ